MVYCEYLEKVDGFWVQEKGLLSVDGFLILLRDYELGNVDIKKAQIGEFILNCNKLYRVLVL